MNAAVQKFAGRLALPSLLRLGARPVARSGETIRSRILLVMAAFVVIYCSIAARLISLGTLDPSIIQRYAPPDMAISAARPDLLDRNGEILATDIKSVSLYAEPRKIQKVMNTDDALDQLATVFPEINTDANRRKLASKSDFEWLKREVTENEREKVLQLGIPGIGFRPENRRFYPAGNSVGHIAGAVNIDNQGIMGLEKYIDDQWLRDLHSLGFANNPNMEPIKLSMDLRVQHVLHDELSNAMQKFQPAGGIGIVLNIKTGEVLGMASMPDFDPNNKPDFTRPENKQFLNRATAGVYEMGSTFKIFSTAMALDSGTISLTDSFDATPLHFGRFTIHDEHSKGRSLTVPEIFKYSSNIGTAREIMKFGFDRQFDYLKKLGLTTKLKTELPEVAQPIVPARWSAITGITAAFGHGISVSPMQTAAAAAAVMNGGHLMSPTFFPRSEVDAMAKSTQVMSKETTDKMRYLMRLNVLVGSGKRAEVPGYRVGGKTGTAEKVENGHYSKTKVFNTFIAVFPIDDPQYEVLVSLDDPKGEKPGDDPLAAYNATPTAGAVIARIAPMLGVMPNFAPDESPVGIPY